MPSDYSQWLQQEARTHEQLAQALRMRERKENMDALEDIIARRSNIVEVVTPVLNRLEPLANHTNTPPGKDRHCVLSSAGDEPKEGPWPIVKPGDLNGLPDSAVEYLVMEYTRLCALPRPLNLAERMFIEEVEERLLWPDDPGKATKEVNAFRQRVVNRFGAVALIRNAIRRTRVEKVVGQLKVLYAVLPPELRDKQPSFLDEWHALARKLKGVGRSLSAQDVAAMLEALPEDLRPNWSAGEVIHKTAIEVWRDYYRAISTDEESPLAGRIEGYVCGIAQVTFRINLTKRVRELMQTYGFLHLCLDELPEVRAACVAEVCHSLDKDQGNNYYLTQAVLCGLLPKRHLSRNYERPIAPKTP